MWWGFIETFRDQPPARESGVAPKYPSKIIPSLVLARAPTVQQGWPRLRVNQTGTSGSVQVLDRPQPSQLSLNSLLRVSHSEQGLCGTGSQTAEHLLQSCPLYNLLGMWIWPGGAYEVLPTSSRRQEYSSHEIEEEDLGDPRGTANFIEETSFHLTNEKMWGTYNFIEETSFHLTNEKIWGTYKVLPISSKRLEFHDEWEEAPKCCA